MLDIALDKLMRGRAEELLARQMGCGMHEGHNVLKLIAESKSAARLVVPASSPQAASQGLIDEPAVDQGIDCRIGCLNIKRAQRALPTVPDVFQRPPRGAAPRLRWMSA